MKPLDETHLAILRRHMVEVVDMHFDLAAEEVGKSAPAPALRRALLDVPRHLFVPVQLVLAAYQDTPLPIGFDKTVSQPFIGALMIDLLDLDSGERVLEIGTGFGYQSALMAALGTLPTAEILPSSSNSASPGTCGSRQSPDTMSPKFTIATRMVCLPS